MKRQDRLIFNGKIYDLVETQYERFVIFVKANSSDYEDVAYSHSERDEYKEMRGFSLRIKDKLYGLKLRRK